MTIEIVWITSFNLIFELFQLRDLLFFNFVISEGHSGNKFTKLYEDDVVVFLWIRIFIDYSHHAEDERWPDILGGQRVPIMLPWVRLLDTLELDVVVKFKHLHYRVIESKDLLLLVTKEPENIFQLFEPLGYLLNNQRIVLNLLPHCNDAALLHRLFKTMLN